VLICLFYSETGQAVAYAERLRKAVAARPFVRRLSISVGVAAAPLDASEWTTLLEQANQRMHAAKARGRNQVVGQE
jgi:diguanylate cyclase (GGDEF)-like protein